MAERPRNILVCSCDDTMPLDGDALARGCRGAEIVDGRQLCRAELERFRTLAAAGAPLTVGCTQEAPLFARSRRRNQKRGRDRASSISAKPPAGRRTPQAGRTENGGAGRRRPRSRCPRSPSSSSTARRHPGLRQATSGRSKPASCSRSISTSRCWSAARRSDAAARDRVSGRDRARSARPKAISAPSSSTVDDYAAPLPSSRATLAFGPARDGAVSRCDILLDISGGPALFPGSRSARRLFARRSWRSLSRAAAVLKARDLAGTFDKPRYINFTRRSVRAFALADRRLPPLPRSLPDRRHRAGRRPCRDRRRRSAPAAANAPPPARPAPRPMRCRPSDALLRKLAHAAFASYREAGRRASRSSCSTTTSMAAN